MTEGTTNGQAMEASIKDRLLDKRWLGEKLKRFRIRHNFSTVKELQLATGLTGLSKNEDGTQYPGWASIIKIVAACNANLSDFVADLEPVKLTDGLTIPSADRPVVQQLLDILEKAPPEAREWLLGNIQVFHERYVYRRHR